MSQPVKKKCSTHRPLILERPFLYIQKGVEMKLNRNCEFRHVLSRFGLGDTRVRGSFIVSITDTFDKIATFISTRNAMYGIFKLLIRLDTLKIQ